MVRRRGSSTRVAAIVPVLLSLAVLTVVFAAGEEERETSRVPVPDIPVGQGESCVEDTDFMRRNHMTLLKHQRDETMLQGIRTRQHSLKECVSCHAVPGADGMAITVDSPQHFCRSCHDYAAVQIDCFDCHASRPADGVMPEDHEGLVGRAAGR